jgi:hypothetical protein
MGGSITVENRANGVSFQLSLARLGQGQGQ